MRRLIFVWRFFATALLVFFFVALTGCTINRTTKEAPRFITVTGSSTVELFPERQILEFTVATSGWSARQLVADLNVITDRFVNNVQTLGVSPADITKSPCTVTNPNQGYDARRTICVVIKDEALIPAIIDCKTTSIRLRNNKLIYPTDINNSLRLARTQAMQNAQESASLLSGAGGARIGSVLRIAGEKINREVIAATTDYAEHEALTVSVKVMYELIP